MTRVHNFNAGPAALPLPVLEKVQAQLVELPGAGMSEMEMSHRSKAFEAILAAADEGMRQLLGLPPEYKVLFLQGGASLQFSMVPMNFLRDGAKADYLVTGAWGEKAFAEAAKIGGARIAGSGRESGYRRLPAGKDISVDPEARYLHFTSNETIDGIQWPAEPPTGAVPLVCDASSDILSRPIDVARYGLIYAGAQKNIGPSGVTVVIVREDWVKKQPQLPVMLDYATHVKDNSMYNTPNTFGIWVIALVCDWLQSLGGLAAVAKRNEAKAAALYEAIDETGFYRGHVEAPYRSRMNVTFRLPGEDLENRFAAEATSAGLIGLKGHRSVGGLRASLYNAVELQDVSALVDFMREFERANG